MKTPFCTHHTKNAKYHSMLSQMPVRNTGSHRGRKWNLCNVHKKYRTRIIEHLNAFDKKLPRSIRLQTKFYKRVHHCHPFNLILCHLHPRTPTLPSHVCCGRPKPRGPPKFQPKARQTQRWGGTCKLATMARYLPILLLWEYFGNALAKDSVPLQRTVSIWLRSNCHPAVLSKCAHALRWSTRQKPPAIPQMWQNPRKSKDQTSPHGTRASFCLPWDSEGNWCPLFAWKFWLPGSKWQSHTSHTIWHDITKQWSTLCGLAASSSHFETDISKMISMFLGKRRAPCPKVWKHVKSMIAWIASRLDDGKYTF